MSSRVKSQTVIASHAANPIKHRWFRASFNFAKFLGTERPPSVSQTVSRESLVYKTSGVDDVSPISVSKCLLLKSLDDDVLASQIPSLSEALALNFAMVRPLVLTSHSWWNVSPRKQLGITDSTSALCDHMKSNR